MRIVEGRVKEIQIDSAGDRMAVIECSPQVIPAPGQYLLAYDPEDQQAALATPLFSRRTTREGFHALPPIPRNWEPGTQLSLRGPLGRGFELHTGAQNLAAIALGNTASYLLAMMEQAVGQGWSVAMFAESPLPPLPTAIEAHHLESFREFMDWTEQVLLSLPLERVASLRHSLGYLESGPLPCPAQALILTPMPCGALAECGVCAISSGAGWRLACKDGPVFDLADINW